MKSGMFLTCILLNKLTWPTLSQHQFIARTVISGTALVTDGNLFMNINLVNLMSKCLVNILNEWLNTGF